VSGRVAAVTARAWTQRATAALVPHSKGLPIRKAGSGCAAGALRTAGAEASRCLRAVLHKCQALDLATTIHHPIRAPTQGAPALITGRMQPSPARSPAAACSTPPPPTAAAPSSSAGG
jgi:hypothetical protein